jgi:hypothetical protein
MTRFPYIQMGSDHTSLTPRLSLDLRLNAQSVSIVALVDTGSTIKVIPYDVGVALGAVWEEQTISVRLAGNLSLVEARGLAVTGYLPQVISDPFELVFAWTLSPQAPILLGQINFFMMFNVCFYRSQAYFEVSPKEI